MKVKCGFITIDVTNCIKDSKNFFCDWNNYIITVEYDKYHQKYSGCCYDPNGGALAYGVLNRTMRQSVQACFDQITFPLRKIGDIYDDE